MIIQYKDGSILMRFNPDDKRHIIGVIDGKASIITLGGCSDRYDVIIALNPSDKELYAITCICKKLVIFDENFEVVFNCP